MEALTLYHNPGSRSERVLKLLHLTGLPHDVLSVSPETLKSPDYLAINPLGTIPTLVHGDRVILESAAQMMYLADLAPEKGLAPPLGSPERGRYYELFVLSVATIEPRAMPAIMDPADADKTAALREAMQHLTDRIRTPFCLGSRFSALDVLVHWQMSFCAARGYLDGMSKAQAYVSELEPRLQWGKAVAV